MAKTAKTKPTINKVSFEKFIDFLSCKGEVENKEALFTLEDNTIKVRVVSPTNVVAISAIFNDYKNENIGNIGIDNLSVLKTFMKTVGDTSDVFLDKKGNKLTLENSTGSVKASVVLRNPEYITNNLTGEKFMSLKDKATGNEFTLTLDIIKAIIQYSRIVGSNNLLLDGKESKLILKVDNNQNEVEAEFNLTAPLKEAFSVRLSSFVLDILSNINQDVTVSAKSDSPVYLLVTNNEYTVEYIVAPIKKIKE